METHSQVPKDESVDAEISLSPSSCGTCQLWLLWDALPSTCAVTLCRWPSSAGTSLKVQLTSHTNPSSGQKTSSRPLVLDLQLYTWLSYRNVFICTQNDHPWEMLWVWEMEQFSLLVSQRFTGQNCSSKGTAKAKMKLLSKRQRVMAEMRWLLLGLSKYTAHFRHFLFQNQDRPEDFLLFFHSALLSCTRAASSRNQKPSLKFTVPLWGYF